MTTRNKASEKVLEKKLRQMVEAEHVGGLAIKLLPFMFTGLPDRLVLLPGPRICFAEIKSTGKALEPRQWVVRGQLERMGFKVWAISTEQELLDFKKYYKL